jgi:hypothetical protein
MGVTSNVTGMEGAASLTRAIFLTRDLPQPSLRNEMLRALVPAGTVRTEE